jgi:hypothetical protein
MKSIDKLLISDLAPIAAALTVSQSALGLPIANNQQLVTSFDPW